MKEAIPVLVPRKGKKYHLKWAKFGCVWMLKSINGDKVELITPKTKLRRIEIASNLIHTRAQQARIEAGMDPYIGRKARLPNVYSQYIKPKL